MKTVKVLFFLLFLFIFPSAEKIKAQEGETDRSYSPDAVNIIIISEQSRSSRWKLKLEALALTGKILESGGGRSPELLDSLEFLAFEGTYSKTRDRGKTTNNYPDVRAKAAFYLGVFGGSDAKKVLVQMLKFEPESMVLIQVVNALSSIGVIDRDEGPINEMFRRIEARHADNLLAFAVLDAYQKYGAENGGKVNIATRYLFYDIIQGAYLKSVKDKAKKLLETLSSSRNGG